MGSGRRWIEDLEQEVWVLGVGDVRALRPSPDREEVRPRVAERDARWQVANVDAAVARARQLVRVARSPADPVHGVAERRRELAEALCRSCDGDRLAPLRGMVVALDEEQPGDEGNRHRYCNNRAQAQPPVSCWTCFGCLARGHWFVRVEC